MQKITQTKGKISKTPLNFDTSISIKIRQLTDQMLTPGNQLHGIPESMSVKEWQVIAVLAKFGKMTNKELCQYIKQGHVAISRVIKKLKRQLLVETKQSESDRRKVEIELTNQGLELHDQISPKRLKLNIEIDNGLTPDERVTFLALIQKLENHVQHINNENED
jgi:DNA-binding MarR family transcriptional regulator